MSHVGAGRKPGPGLVLCLGALLLYAAISLAAPNPPFSYDYPEWVYHGVVLKDWLLGTLPPAYLLKPYPVPNSLTQILVGVSSLLLPWQLVAKLFWVLDGALLLLATRHMMETLGRREDWLWPVMLTVGLFNSLYWWGNSNFVFGLPMLLFTASLYLRGTLTDWKLALLSLLVFFTHAADLMALGCLAAAAVWQRRSLRPVFALTPAILLSAAYAFGRFFLFHNADKVDVAATIPTFSLLFPLFKLNTLVKSLGFINPIGPHGPILEQLGGVATLAALEAIAGLGAVAFVCLSVQGCLRTWRERREPERMRLLWLIVALWAVIWLVTPQRFLSVTDFGQRAFQIMAVLSLPLAFQCNVSGRLLAATCAIFLAVNLVLVAALAWNPRMPGTDAPLPGFLRRFGAVDPFHRPDFYAAIAQDRMTLDIYPSGMILRKTPPPR